MDIRFTLEGAYKSQGAASASAAVHLTIAEGFGKSVALDIFFISSVSKSQPMLSIQ